MRIGAQANSLGIRLRVIPKSLSDIQLYHITDKNTASENEKKERTRTILKPPSGRGTTTILMRTDL